MFVLSVLILYFYIATSLITQPKYIAENTWTPALSEISLIFPIPVVIAQKTEQLQWLAIPKTQKSDGKGHFSYQLQRKKQYKVATHICFQSIDKRLFISLRKIPVLPKNQLTNLLNQFFHGKQTATTNQNKWSRKTQFPAATIQTQLILLETSKANYTLWVSYPEQDNKLNRFFSRNSFYKIKNQ